VATCQFAVTGNVRRNANQIERQIRQAKRRRADVVHFPECALTGYVGKELTDWQGYDWARLRSETERVCALARQTRLWVIVGSAHPLTGRHRPHNCVYAIGPHGRIVDRYDKRFCTGADLKHYTPGDHLAVFEIQGVRCGILICYDVRFPELYRAYRKRGVQCMFHSFHNARAEKGPNIWTTIMRPTMQARAASNYMWVSGTNSSAYYQCWPSVLIRPDGEVAGSLRQHRAGILVHTVDTREALYDASAPYRRRAMQGLLHSGRVVRDLRSADRTSL
jgi:predicted amidohydrolase